jgi:hypothetical protein
MLRRLLGIGKSEKVNNPESEVINRHVVFQDVTDPDKAEEKGVEPGYYVLLFPVKKEEYADDDFLIRMHSQIRKAVVETGMFPQLEDEGKEVGEVTIGTPLHYRNVGYQEIPSEKWGTNGLVAVKIEHEAQSLE